MRNLFMSYRGIDRSRVREVIADLERYGLCHTILHDLDEGDQRARGSSYVYEKIVKPILKQCEGLVLLIGDTTHQPKITLKQELEYVKSKEWYVFGISLTKRSGGTPSDLERYKYYISLEYDPSVIVSEIAKRIPCE